ncbi:hypothetical protein ACIBM3_29285 [Rhodococcus erythropolis]|uniref:hypothetical protein n=1 Tax=Rhodococcus erythropolis TaxID=1833 RepID=UPI0037995F55
MREPEPVPLGADGIDIQAILRGSRIPQPGYRTEFGGNPVRITVNRRCVDDDGTFIPDTGNRMLSFAVTDSVLQPSTAIDVVRHAAPVNLGPVYIYVPDLEKTWSRYLVAAFFSGSGSMTEAPPDFGWRKYSNMFRDFSVHRADNILGPLTPVYHSLNHDFYQPYMDRRGRYWALRVTAPPESSGLGEAFAAALGALSRRSAIRSDIRALALEWLHGGIVRFTFQRILKQRCFRLEFEIPSVNQMAFGRFLLPGSPIIREPAQFAAGLVYRFYEASAASYSLFGTEVVCDEKGNPPR